MPYLISDLIKTAIHHGVITEISLYERAIQCGEDWDKLAKGLVYTAHQQRHWNKDGNTAVCKANNAYWKAKSLQA